MCLGVIVLGNAIGNSITSRINDNQQQGRADANEAVRLRAMKNFRSQALDGIEAEQRASEFESVRLRAMASYRSNALDDMATDASFDNEPSGREMYEAMVELLSNQPTNSNRSGAIQVADNANYAGNIDDSYSMSLLSDEDRIDPEQQWANWKAREAQASVDGQVCTPANPLGLPLKEWVAWSMSNEGLFNRMQTNPLPANFDGHYLAPDNAVNMRAERERFQRNMGMALAGPPAAGLVSVGAYATLAPPATTWTTSQLAMQPARFATVDLLKSMAAGGTISTGTYLLVHQEESTPAGMAVAFGGGSIAGTVKYGMNVAAELPNTAIPFTYSNAVTQGTGAVYGFGTFKWLNVGDFTATGDSWWTRPIFAPSTQEKK